MSCVTCWEKFDVNIRIPIVGKCGHTACKPCILTPDDSRIDPAQGIDGLSPCYNCSRCRSVDSFKEMEENTQIIEILMEIKKEAEATNPAEIRTVWPPASMVTSAEGMFEDFRAIISEIGSYCVERGLGELVDALERVDAPLRQLQENGHLVDASIDKQEILRKSEKQLNEIYIFDSNFISDSNGHGYLLEDVADDLKKIARPFLKSKKRVVRRVRKEDGDDCFLEVRELKPSAPGETFMTVGNTSGTHTAYFVASHSEDCLVKPTVGTIYPGDCIMLHILHMEKEVEAADSIQKGEIEFNYAATKNRHGRGNRKLNQGFTAPYEVNWLPMFERDD